MAQNRHFLMRIGQQPGGPGRNTKYDPDIHPARVMELAQEGEFPEAWAADMGVTFFTLRLWCRDHPEFSDAMEAARLLLETYWTRDLVKNRLNPDARPGLYNLILRRFGHYYGLNAPDVWGFFHSRDVSAAPVGSTPQQPGEPEAKSASGMTLEQIEERLRELRAREEEFRK